MRKLVGIAAFLVFAGTSEASFYKDEGLLISTYQLEIAMGGLSAPNPHMFAKLRCHQIGHHIVCALPFVTSLAATPYTGPLIGTAAGLGATFLALVANGFYRQLGWNAENAATGWSAGHLWTTNAAIRSAVHRALTGRYQQLDDGTHGKAVYLNLAVTENGEILDGSGDFQIFEQGWIREKVRLGTIPQPSCAQRLLEFIW